MRILEWGATIIYHDGSLRRAVHVALGVYGFEAFKRWFTDTPELRWRRFGRVATRRQRNVGGHGRSHIKEALGRGKLRVVVLFHSLGAFVVAGWRR